MAPRSRRFVRAIAIALVALAAGAQPVMAECPYVPDYPPVVPAVRTAADVIVGTVLDNPGGQIHDFHLRVDRVLRGRNHVGDIVRITSLFPGWPTEPLDGGGTIAPCVPIRAAPGNVIVLVRDALAPDRRTRYNTIGWISGKPPFPDMNGYEVVSINDVTAAAELPPTDAAPTRETGRGQQPLWLSWVAIWLVAIVAIDRARASTRRRRPG
jgi:hypothetical protein